jgi:NADH-quinone oxidoreductase subunit L
MRIAMSILALLAVVGGALQIPGVDHAINNFLAPSFQGSHLASLEPGTGTEWVGLLIGAVVGLFGITLAYRLYVSQPGASLRLQQRLGPVHAFLVNKWYFDELIDYVVVRPALLIGRVADSVLERIVISGGVTGGVTGMVRAGSATVRRAQTGFLRYYAAAIVLGLGALSLYFLISST